MTIDCLAVIGAGMIGGSLARALRTAGFCNDVIGFGRNADALKKAVALGAIGRFAADAAGAVQDADLVVLAAPLATMEPLCRAIGGALQEHAVVTDVGSAKRSVVEAARTGLGAAFPRFVPGHPIAGKEKSGVEHSSADLFRDHLVILTPVPETLPGALQLVRDMWQAAGARLVELDVDHHDRVLAATSHLPHMLAFALVDCLARLPEQERVFDFAAGGFADFSRIASSSPVMWRDVCLANRSEILRALDRFAGELNELRTVIERGDGDGLLEIFSRAKEARDAFSTRRGR
jgi:prephenate dehydrogenase